MSPFFVGYLALWGSLCAAVVLMLLWDRKGLSVEWCRYGHFLCVPWKLALFFPALLFVTFAGRFTDDETWDVVTGAGMSILTFLTAPWALGLFYQVATGKRPARYLMVAVVMCLFSSSWFYDGYLFLRDGFYTPRWWSNLLLSPIIYTAAGLLWNLESRSKGGVCLAFTRSDWPAPPAEERFIPLIPLALLLMFVAGFVLVAFVRWRF